MRGIHEVDCMLLYGVPLKHGKYRSGLGDQDVVLQFFHHRLLRFLLEFGRIR